MLASLNFYIDEINKSGGVLNGRKLEVVPFDNENYNKYWFK